MTFKTELKRTRRRQAKKLKRTKEERKLIDQFIKARLREEASNGRNSAEFLIAGCETVENPVNQQVVRIKKSDYIYFALRYRLRYAVYVDLNYKELNKIVLFF